MVEMILETKEKEIVSLYRKLSTSIFPSITCSALPVFELVDKIRTLID